MQDMCDYTDCALKNIYKRCSMYEFNIEIWGNFFDFALPVENNSYICIWKFCKSRHRFLHFY